MRICSERTKKQRGEKDMKKTVLNIDGMMCGMCESHVNDAIRAAFDVKKVTSSHAKGRTEILSENGIDEKKATETLAAIGYKVTGYSEEEEAEKKKKFFFF